MKLHVKPRTISNNKRILFFIFSFHQWNVNMLRLKWNIEAMFVCFFCDFFGLTECCWMIWILLRLGYILQRLVLLILVFVFKCFKFPATGMKPFGTFTYSLYVFWVICCFDLGVRGAKSDWELSHSLWIDFATSGKWDEQTSESLQPRTDPLTHGREHTATEVSIRRGFITHFVPTLLRRLACTLLNGKTDFLLDRKPKKRHWCCHREHGREPRKCLGFVGLTFMSVCLTGNARCEL